MSQDYTECRDCGRKWSGYSECHCRKCHRHFGGISGFDAHMDKGKCGDPPAVSKEGRPLFELVDKKYGKAWVSVRPQLPTITPTSWENSEEKAVSV